MKTQVDDKFVKIIHKDIKLEKFVTPKDWWNSVIIWGIFTKK